MTSTVGKSGLAAGAATGSWSVERPKAAASVMPFFPDQNGGVYEKLLANMPVMLHAMDGSGRLISVNSAWCEILGYNPQDVVGRSFSEFMPMESRKRMITEIYPQYLVSSGIRSQPLTLHRKDGKLIPVRLSMTAYRGEKGRLEQSVCVLEDASEQPVLDSGGEKRFRAAFEAAANGLALISISGSIQMANAALGKILERGDLGSSDVSFETLLKPQDRLVFLDGVRRLLGGEAPVLRLELAFMWGLDRQKTCAVSIAVVRNEEGKPEQLIAEVRDLSERETAQAQLQRAQRMEAVGQLTSGLAHAFNNLLTVIVGNLELVEGKAGLDAASSKRVSESLETAKRGASLTRQLMTMASKPDAPVKAINVAAAVRDLAPLLAGSVGEHIEFTCNVREPEAYAVLDAAQLELVLINLAVHARGALQDGGKLGLKTRHIDISVPLAAKIGGLTAGPYIELEVSTSAESGSRFGSLDLVRHFAKDAGGSMLVESGVGIGTSVRIYLPRKEKPVEFQQRAKPAAVASVAKPDQAQPAAPAPASKKKILVVEDQEAVRAVASGFLEDFGYEIIEAADGFEALAVLQEQPGIDLMFSDVVMPGGMNGFDLAQAALQLRPDLKVVHTSGYPKGAVAHQNEPRFKDGRIIMKPYRRDELQKIMAEALGSG